MERGASRTWSIPGIVLVVCFRQGELELKAQLRPALGVAEGVESLSGEFLVWGIFFTLFPLKRLWPGFQALAPCLRPKGGCLLLLLIPVDASLTSA